MTSRVPGLLRFASRALLGVWGLALALFPGGCGGGKPVVVVYAAQDRVHAEPLLREFGAREGVEVRAVYDNEATKTTGLANRVLGERARPQADLWWSNEELRTRQLVKRGALEPNWTAFGRRERVLVVAATNAPFAMPPGFGLAGLTNAALRGRIAMAYPLFGTTATHLVVLRERWGAAAWEAWCRALHANRPLLVDGNSVVVQLVARGDAWVGLTDSDDVAAARREGLAVRAIPLPPEDGLAIPNTLAVVRNAGHPEVARRLAAYLRGPEAVERLIRGGALDPDVPAGSTGLLVPPEGVWERALEGLDTSLAWLGGTFQR